MPVVSGIPARTLEQRFEALERANDIRSYRAQLKRDLKARRLSARDVLFAAGGVDREMVATMKVYDVLVHVPKWGRVKVSRRLSVARISPSKTIEGLSARQRWELAAVLPRGVR